MTGALERHGEGALMLRTGPGPTARLDLAALGEVPAQAWHVLVVDVADLVDTEATDPAPGSVLATELAPTPAPAPAPAAGRLALWTHDDVSRDRCDRPREAGLEWQVFNFRFLGWAWHRARTGWASGLIRRPR